MLLVLLLLLNSRWNKLLLSHHLILHHVARHYRHRWYKVSMLINNHGWEHLHRGHIWARIVQHGLAWLVDTHMVGVHLLHRSSVHHKLWSLTRGHHLWHKRRVHHLGRCYGHRPRSNRWRNCWGSCRCLGTSGFSFRGCCYLVVRLRGGWCFFLLDRSRGCSLGLGFVTRNFLRRNLRRVYGVFFRGVLLLRDFVTNIWSTFSQCLRCLFLSSLVSYIEPKICL